VYISEVKATIIHPATDKQLQKYQAQKLYLVSETPEIHKSVCLPVLEDEKLNLQVCLHYCEEH
jgi:m7GpppX diphosphatase